MQPLVFHVFVGFGFCCWSFAVLVAGGMLLNWGALCLLEFVVCLSAWVCWVRRSWYVFYCFVLLIVLLIVVCMCCTALCSCCFVGWESALKEVEDAVSHPSLSTSHPWSFALCLPGAPCKGQRGQRAASWRPLQRRNVASLRRFQGS